MKGLDAISPSGWKDYELIDCGGFEKLERYGRWVVRRPEPQAIWAKHLTGNEWHSLANASFRKEGGSDERGEWTLSPQMPQQWTVGYHCRGRDLRLRLGLTSFKHVGVFPEQAENWDYIFDRTKDIASDNGGAPVRVLNLFAYTGGATLAARAASAEVTHVDSVKQVVSWARENVEASGLGSARWIVDDAMKFVRREARRGNSYDGIILDPPAYGRGPDGEKWVLEQHLADMLSECSQLLSPQNSFLVLNLYSMGLSALLAKTAVNCTFGNCGDEQFGELYIPDRYGKTLPLGVYYRFMR